MEQCNKYMCDTVAYRQVILKQMSQKIIFQETCTETGNQFLVQQSSLLNISDTL